MLLNELVEVSAEVADNARPPEEDRGAGRRARATGAREIPIAVAYLSGELPHPPIGIGWAALRDRPPEQAPPPVLTVLDVDASLRKIGATTGPGSQAARREELADLLPVRRGRSSSSSRGS